MLVKRHYTTIRRLDIEDIVPLLAAWRASLNFPFLLHQRLRQDLLFRPPLRAAVQRIRFNEANLLVQKLEEALHAIEHRAAAPHDEEDLEHLKEANLQVQKLEEALRTSEIRATALHDQLENERLEHHATREALRFEQLQHQVTAMEVPPEAAENRPLNRLSRLNEDINHVKNQQGWFIKEGMLAREMHARSNNDIMPLRPHG